MLAAKRTLYFTALYVLSFVFIYFMPSTVHRRDFDRAYFAFYKDPTPENATALRVQERINNYFYFGFAAVGAIIPLSLGCGIYVLGQYAHYKWKQLREPNSRS
jgi:hypothetical protein